LVRESPSLVHMRLGGKMAWQFNLWGINTTPIASEKELAPDICAFCGKPVEEDDYYWLGFDRHMIFAGVCDGLYCKGWLKWKVKRRKG